MDVVLYDNEAKRRNVQNIGVISPEFNPIPWDRLATPCAGRGQDSAVPPSDESEQLPKRPRTRKSSEPAPVEGAAKAVSPASADPEPEVPPARFQIGGLGSSGGTTP